MLTEASHAVWVRAMRFGVYAILGTAGALILTERDGLLRGWYEVTGWFVLIGCLLCIAGVITDRWAGELLGLALAGTGVFALGIVVLDPGDGHFHVTNVISSLLLVAFSAALATRWVALWFLSIHARRGARRGLR